MFSPHHHSRPEPLPVYSIPTLRHELLACLREMESQSPERNLFLTDVLTKLMQYPGMARDGLISELRFAWRVIVAFANGFSTSIIIVSG